MSLRERTSSWEGFTGLANWSERQVLLAIRTSQSLGLDS